MMIDNRLPLGWKPERLRHLAVILFSNVDKHTLEGELPVRLCNYTDVYYNSEILPTLSFMEATATLSEIARFRLKSGDVLVTKDSETADDIAVPAYVPETLDGVICGYHLAQVRPYPDRISGKFLYYCFSASGVRDHFSVEANGVTRFGLSQGAFKDAALPLPPRPEQDAIVAFLDRKLEQVDRFIATKQRLIVLLQEQKTALINRAVTKGLNPNAPMKHSGIDWLGEIPSHWEVEKAKRLFKQSALPIRDEDGVVTCFRDGQVTLRTNRRTDGFTVAILEQGYQGVRVGQLVLHSMDAFAGAIGVSESDGKCTPEYVVCDPKRPDANPHYYAPLLREMARQNWIEIVCQAVRERAPRLRFSTFGEMPLPIPPNEEQDAICRFIESEKAQVEQVAERTRKEIELIQELRTTLISDAVTGRIKMLVEDER